MIKHLILAIVAFTGVSANEPPRIHVNQIGFLPDGAKRAVVAAPSRAPLRWRLIDARNRQAASGMTTVFGDDPVSGDHVHRITFDQVRTPGTYRLEVGGALSNPFPVAAGIYRPLARSALNFFYQQRAGTPVEARYAGGANWARAAGHPHEVVTCFKGADQRGTVWPGCAYTLDVTGGWYDAGDHGKYVVNGGIALWTLQNLAEAGHGPDGLRDETRWELEFLLRMQIPAGERMRLPIGLQPSGPLRLTPVDAGGMAHTKVADRNWTRLPTIPAEDREERPLYPPSTAATLNLAAVAAQGARLWRDDPEFAARCLDAATRAWAAARRNPAIYAAQAFTGSGGYGDRRLTDEFSWAASELFATTGGAEYAAAAHVSPVAADPSWANVAALGTITLATAATVPPAEQAAARAAIVATAARFVAEEARSGYHIPYATAAYPWGSNSNILNRAMILLLAERFTGERRYRDAAIDAADYVLGRNPLDQSYVSGFGWNPMRRPHHRFWAHQFDARLPEPPPGVLSGGPNNTAWADDVARSMKGKCAPQRCWRDDSRGFAMNEVAINWNAPLVWVAANLDMPQR